VRSLLKKRNAGRMTIVDDLIEGIEENTERFDWGRKSAGALIENSLVVLFWDGDVWLNHSSIRPSRQQRKRVKKLFRAHCHPKK
jgi:hypothetical protein